MSGVEPHRTVSTGHDRTLRLLEARLEVLASVCERAPATARHFETQVQAVAATTRRAVDLELISAAEAEAIWAAVASRHPSAAWCGAGPLAA